MDVALAEDQILLAAYLDFESGVGCEQHAVAFFHVPHRRPDGDHLAPRQSPIAVGSGRNQNPAPALAVAYFVRRQDQEPIGGHPDGLLTVVVTRVRAVGHSRRLLPAFAVSGPCPGFDWPSTGFEGFRT